MRKEPSKRENRQGWVMESGVICQESWGKNYTKEEHVLRMAYEPYISATAVTIHGATGGHGLKVGIILRLSYQCL